MNLDGLADELFTQFHQLHLRTGKLERQRLLLDIAKCWEIGGLVPWEEPSAIYCAQLLAALVSRGRIALVRYLEALANPVALGLGPDDRTPLIALRLRIETLSDDQWQHAFPPSRFQNALDSRYATRSLAIESDLDALRAADDKCGTGTKYPTLDHIKLLVECDLEPPCDEFARQLGAMPAAGIYTFAMAGDQKLLQNFVLQRLQYYLSRELSRKDIASHFFWAVPGVDGIVDLRPEFKSGSPVPHWQDQFRLFASDEVDHFVVVWNARLSVDDMVAFAMGLQRDLYPSLLPVVQQNDQLFLVLWADIEHEFVVRQPSYCCLPMPDRLEPDKVHWHFDYHLRREKVLVQDRTCALNKLDDYFQRTGAKAKSAFPQMESIVDQLKFGRI